MQLSRMLSLPGVANLQRFAGLVRLQLTLPGAPARIEIKLYEDAAGAVEAVASHLPPLGRAAKPASPARPAPAARPVRQATPFDPYAPLGEPYRSPEAAVEGTVQLLTRLADRANGQAWEPNPKF